MDWLEFVASLTRSLAWPITLVVLVFFLRVPITRALLKLTRLKYKDLELDFSHELKQLEDKARAVDIAVRQPRILPAGEKDSPQLLEEAARLAQDFPEAAVALGWQAVEDELMSSVLRLAISPDPPSYNSPLKNAQLLKDQHVIDENTFELLNRIRKLRNIAVHHTRGAGAITTADAVEFLAIANGVAQRLQTARRG